MLWRVQKEASEFNGRPRVDFDARFVFLQTTRVREKILQSIVQANIAVGV